MVWLCPLTGLVRKTLVAVVELGYRNRSYARLRASCVRQPPGGWMRCNELQLDAIRLIYLRIGMNLVNMEE